MDMKSSAEMAKSTDLVTQVVSDVTKLLHKPEMAAGAKLMPDGKKIAEKGRIAKALDKDTTGDQVESDSDSDEPLIAVAGKVRSKGPKAAAVEGNPHMTRNQNNRLTGGKVHPGGMSLAHAITSGVKGVSVKIQNCDTPLSEKVGTRRSVRQSSVVANKKTEEGSVTGSTATIIGRRKTRSAG